VVQSSRIYPFRPEGSLLRHGFQLFWASLKEGLFGRRYKMAIDITDRCTNHCRHCSNRERGDARQEEEPTPEQWEERFDGYRRRGIISVIMVGGEPALRPDVLLAAHRRFLHVTTITNGQIKIPESFQRRIYVSLDGPEEITGRLRGRGAFRRVLANYEGDRRAVLNCVLTAENHQVVGTMMEIVREMGVAGVSFNLYGPNIGEQSPLILSREQRREIEQQMLEARSKHRSLFFMNRRMIRWLCDGRHADRCLWRSRTVHQDLRETPRKCYSDTFDCDQCGCHSGAVTCTGLNNLLSLPMFLRLFFG